MELVLPLFPTLLKLIKKRAPPYPHGIATSDIYSTVVIPCIFPPSYACSLLSQDIVYIYILYSRYKILIRVRMNKITDKRFVYIILGQ
jgi:hypothetical protein